MASIIIFYIQLTRINNINRNTLPCQYRVGPMDPAPCSTNAWKVLPAITNPSSPSPIMSMGFLVFFPSAVPFATCRGIRSESSKYSCSWICWTTKKIRPPPLPILSLLALPSTISSIWSSNATLPETLPSSTTTLYLLLSPTSYSVPQLVVWSINSFLLS